jgi:hypothetical protein
MIKKAVFENDLIYGMQRELQANDKKEAMEHLPQAVDYLQAALEILEEHGLTSQADQILSILAKIGTDQQDAQGKSKKPKDPRKIHDPHIPRSSEEEVRNYQQHGWAFNMADDGQDLLDADINDADLEVEDPQTDKDFEEEG